MTSLSLKEVPGWSLVTNKALGCYPGFTMANLSCISGNLLVCDEHMSISPCIMEMLCKVNFSIAENIKWTLQPVNCSFKTRTIIYQKKFQGLV
jgi:hypothetical protein